MDCIRDLIEMWMEKPFTKEEMIVVDGATYSALRVVQAESRGDPTGLLELFPKREGTFNRLMEYMKLSQDQPMIMGEFGVEHDWEVEMPKTMHRGVEVSRSPNVNR